MNKNKTLLIIVLVFVLLLGGAYALYNRLAQDAAPDQLSVQGGAEAQTAPQSEKPQQNTGGSGDESTEPEKILAPDFTVYDSEGNEVHLSDFTGKPIVLNFWASWCGPCRSEMPDIQKAYETYGQDIHFLIVNLTDGSRETVEAARDYVSQEGYTFPVYFDTTLHAASVYGAYSIPMTFFIGAEGQPIARYSGAMPADILQQGIDMLLSE